MTLGFTCNGLRAFGVPPESLGTFSEAFRQGMAARADTLKGGAYFFLPGINAMRYLAALD